MSIISDDDGRIYSEDEEEERNVLNNVFSDGEAQESGGEGRRSGDGTRKDDDKNVKKDVKPKKKGPVRRQMISEDQ